MMKNEKKILNSLRETANHTRDATHEGVIGLCFLFVVRVDFFLSYISSILMLCVEINDERFEEENILKKKQTNICYIIFIVIFQILFYFRLFSYSRSSRSL